MYDENLSLDQQPAIDYTDDYNRSYGSNAVAVHACGTEMLVLWELKNKREISYRDKRGRSRTKPATHAIESYTLACVADDGSDTYCRVLHGPDTLYLSKGDVKPMLREAGKSDGSLFRSVSLLC